MNRILLSLSLMMCVSLGISQSDVVLQINHKLGVEDFLLDAVGTNNLGHDFKTSRLEYYVTRISIIHDGGTETTVPDEVVALVRPEDEISTSIDLGSFDVTLIESVKFFIGVYAPLNNDDPSIWEVTHPLGPKSPSMHWGWASGYRFIAYEGYGGVDFSQNFQLHGLGNENYFEIASDVNVEDVSGTLVMSLNGNYAAGLTNISLTDGTISHGTTDEAKQVLENWRDLVFGLYTVGLDEELNSPMNWSIYPNPSNSEIRVSFSDLNDIETFNVVNSLGEIVRTHNVTQKEVSITIEHSGVYMIMVLNKSGETIATKRIIIQ